MNLCIDWGNTLVKACIFDPQGKMILKQQFEATDAESRLSSIISSHQPDAGILCAVVDIPGSTLQILQGQIRKFIVLDMNTRLPILNAYHSPETLGVDRLALVTGAYAQFPDKNNLVVSLGTCITYNLIQKTKAFRGGAIAPGMQMRLKAMHDYTDKLPLVSAQGELLLLGYDTETSIRSGAIFGMAAEIDGIIQTYAEKYPDFNAVLTGGDAPLFEDKLKSKIFADPDLSLKGLNLILNYNVPQLR